MTKSWDDLRREFEHIAFQRGIENVASSIPANRVTVYRLLNGTTRRPTKKTLEGIERVVEEEKGKWN